ncbi:integrase catalytic domain-containing protein [Trichonephila clavipes]|nr:integrase catalytic domain-containing protein [Trichonephila clavipes]
MNPIEKIKNKRAPIRLAVTKLITKIQNYFENNSDDADNILELQDQLIQKELSLKQLNSEMENLIVDASEFDAEINLSEKIISIKYKIKSYIKRRECNLNVLNSTQVWSHQNRPQLSIKLPEIPLPKFSGKYEEWSNFKIQFNNIISTNSQLSSEQKLHYLKAALTSEAKNLETISDSFESLFKTLEERYENKRLIVEMQEVESKHAVLDSGSMSNIVTLDFANRLGAPQNRINIPISSLGGNKTTAKSILNATIINGNSSFSTTSDFLVVSKITDFLPVSQINLNNFKIPQELADPNFGIPGKIDLLIGAEAFFDIN